MGGRAATILVALCAALFMAAPTAAAPSIFIPEPLQVEYDAIVSPKTLSKTKRTPVVVRTLPASRRQR